MDIWACATVVYRLLSRRFPFAGESGEANLCFSCVYSIKVPSQLALICWHSLAESSIKASILDQHNKPDFALAPWDDISLAAKDVLRRMFARKVKNRPIAREVLERAWFSGLSSGELNFVLIVLWLDRRSLMLFLLTCSSGMRMFHDYDVLVKLLTAALSTLR